MSPRPTHSPILSAQGLKVARWLLAALLLSLAPTAHAEETRESLSQRSAQSGALREQGKFAEAEKEQRALLALREQVLGADDPDTLQSRNDLANALLDLGKDAEAELEYRAVLAERERVLGAEQRDVFQSCYNLAVCLQVQGKSLEALPFIQRAETGYQKVLGPDHQYTHFAQMKRDLIQAAAAQNLYQQGKLAEAEQEYRAVLAARERDFGPNHLDTLQMRNNLGYVLAKEGKHEEAEQELRAVLAMRERVLTMKHPDVFRTCSDLATTLAARGKYAEALTFSQRTRDGFEELWGHEHPEFKRAKALCEQIKADLAKEKAKGEAGQAGGK